jgi:hypothetical protein
MIRAIRIVTRDSHWTLVGDERTIQAHVKMHLMDLVLHSLVLFLEFTHPIGYPLVTFWNGGELFILSS